MKYIITMILRTISPCQLCVATTPQYNPPFAENSESLHPSSLFFFFFPSFSPDLILFAPPALLDQLDFNFLFRFRGSSLSAGSESMIVVVVVVQTVHYVHIHFYNQTLKKINGSNKADHRPERQ